MPAARRPRKEGGPACWRKIVVERQRPGRRASGRSCGPSVPFLRAIASARFTGTTTTTSKAPRNKQNAITYKPTSKRWVKSPIQPTRYGLTKPAKPPMELIRAIPAAAAEPASIAVGIVQESGKEDKIPAVASESATIAAETFEGNKVLKIRPTPPARAQIAKCHRRSPVRSELLPTNIIATAAQPYGIAAKSPI